MIGWNRMSDITPELRFERLMEANRLRCLWFLGVGYRPTDRAGMLAVLDAIEKRGDLQSFKEARSLRVWLSQSSSDESSGS
jgi:hypothetical protein